MCGIFGFSHSTPLTRLLTPTLAICMEQRGDHSWGVTDGETIYKIKGSIIDTFVDMDLDGPIYHTRMASVGAISDRNAHPFQSSAKYVVTGIHNGHIGNWSALKDKYKDRSAMEVDSEHIFAHLAEERDVAELNGSGAIVWYQQLANKSDKMVRYFSRFNSESMHFVKFKSGEIAFASTKDSLIIASQLAGGNIEHFFDTEQKKRYWIEPDPDRRGHMNLYGDIMMPWGEKPVSWAPTVSTSNTRNFGNEHWPSHGGRYRGGLHSISGGDCPARFCNNGKITEDQVICEFCLSELRKDIFGEAASV